MHNNKGNLKNYKKFLKTKNSYGYDEISTKILKKAAFS
jgi:hypothetical protein